MVHPVSPAASLPVTYADIDRAAHALQGIAHRTPVFTSTTVDQRTQSQVFFKCENFQRTGSFKFRGAFNALSQLTDAQKKVGVAAFSSGNHAQAIALAGQLLHIPTTIVMPTDAPAVKVAATRGYGAQIVFYDRHTQAREVIAQQLATDHGFASIPPFDHAQVIAGQGTAAKELIEEVGTLDMLLVCCGGGGLLSGSAIATRYLAPACQVIGVEPKRGDDATQSFYARTRIKIPVPDTIADGARTQMLGDLTWPIILATVQDMVTVSEVAIARTQHYIWERLKLVVEPTGVLAAAALLEGIVTAPQQRVGVILSGGNVDLHHTHKVWAMTRKSPKPTVKAPWARELS